MDFTQFYSLKTTIEKSDKQCYQKIVILQSTQMLTKNFILQYCNMMDKLKFYQQNYIPPIR